jgi:TRAP-type mannitol/chloroaromatic compound transport system substrate-binding protein
VVKETTNQSVLDAFAKQFGDTVYGAMARARLEELRKPQVAIAPPAAAAAGKPSDVSATPEQRTTPVKNERNFRLASSFPSAMTEVFEPSQQFVKEVQSASAGRLKLQLFAAGQITPGLQVLDSVMNGSVELGWTPASFYIGKNAAFAAIGGGLPLGLDTAAFVGWLEGPGRSVRAGVYEEAGAVKSFPCSINGPRGLWVRKELKSLEDLKGLKLRLQPPTQLVFQPFGVIPQQISAADTYPALERGTIDGLEWMTPPMDERLGWHKVAKYLYYPFGEAAFSTVSDLLINKKVWDELEPSAQDMIEKTCKAQLRSDLVKLTEGVQAALQRMRAAGAIIGPTPQPIAAKYREGVRAFLDQNIRSPAGLAAWQSLKAVSKDPSR